MMRVLIILGSLWFCQTITNASAVVWDVNTVPLSFLPAVWVLGAYYQKPIEAAWTAILAGLLLDGLVGMPLGPNGLISLLGFGLCALAAIWLGRPSSVVLWACITASSLVYRLILIPLFLMLWNRSSNFEWWPTLFVPMVDGIIGLALIYIWNAIFATLKIGGISREDGRYKIYP